MQSQENRSAVQAAAMMILLRARFFGSLCKANAADGDPAYSADSAAAAAPFAGYLCACRIPAALTGEFPCLRGAYAKIAAHPERTRGICYFSFI